MTLTHKTSASCSPPPFTTDIEKRWQTRQGGGGQVSAGAIHVHMQHAGSLQAHPQGPQSIGPGWLTLTHSSFPSTPPGADLCAAPNHHWAQPSWHLGLTQFLP